MSGVSPLFTKKAKQDFWWIASYLGVKVHCSWQPPCSSSSVTVVRVCWPYWVHTAILAHRKLSVSKYCHWAHFTLCCMTIIITIGIAYCHSIFIVDSCSTNWLRSQDMQFKLIYIHINPLNPELNPIWYLLTLLGAHNFLHVSRIRVKLLTFRLLMSYIYIYSYIYGAPILDVSRSHTTTQHSR